MPSTPLFYQTIAAPCEGAYSEKRSRFLGFAFPVESESEAAKRVTEIKQKYFDARHICWAYVLGKREKRERVQDDGEPSSTAGKPILGQIHSLGLTNCIVIVVRYFGGIKLGTGGLIVAYRSCAEETLAKAQILKQDLVRSYRLKFGFDLINPVMRLLKTAEATTTNSDSDTNGYIWEVLISEKNRTEFESLSSKLYTLQLIPLEEEE